MAVYYRFSAPPQVTNTFPEVAFTFSGLFGLPTCLFVRLSPPDNSTKMPNVTYISVIKRQDIVIGKYNFFMK